MGQSTEGSSGPKDQASIPSGASHHVTMLQHITSTKYTYTKYIYTTRHQTRWNLQGCPKLTKRSQLLVGRSSPYYEDMWRIYCCLTSFFPIVDTCLICEDIARRSCAMVPRWRFLATFLRPVFAASRVQHISDLHSKFALGQRHV